MFKTLKRKKKMTLRFKKFLQESQMDLHDVADLINLNCKPFLSEAGQRFMFRGMDVAGDRKTLPAHSRHPPEREPRDSLPWFNLMFNGIIHAAYGIEDVRYRSYFAVGDIGSAAAYGDIFRVYPQGDFEFIWSESIEDSVLSENTILYALVNALRNKGENITDGNLKTLFKKLSRFTSTSTDLIDGTLDDEIKSCIEFVSTHTNSETFPQIFRECLSDAGNLLYRTSDMLAALKSNHEIIIHKSDGYYTIPLGYADGGEVNLALSL